MAKPYMPSNGTEGAAFIARFCDRCIRQHPNPDKSPQCDEILLQSMIGNQPKEWVYNEQGQPLCTAFKAWEWGNGEGGQYNEPPKPEPIGWNQLFFPFCITYFLKFDKPIGVCKTAIFELED